MASSILSRNEVPTTHHGTEQECLSICLVGGIYGKDEQYRAKFKMTPEILLEGGLKARGHRVVTAGHREPIDSRNVDIIHVHHLGIAGLYAATDPSSAAFVYTSHDGPAMAGISEGTSRRLASHFIMSRADAVVALSQTEIEFQRRSYSLMGAVHTVIPNGINTDNYQYFRNNREGKGLRWQLLFVGQLVEIKGVDDLIRALALLPRNVELLLAFQVDTMRDRLEQLARQMGVLDQVCFLGGKTPDELKTLYQCADIFVLPSFGEALPSVVTEAMLCGTPVIATDVGGIRDQLGSYGIVVPPRNSEALAHAITYMLAHYDEFKTRGAAMSEYAMRRFSIPAMVESHLQLYRALSREKIMRRRNLYFKKAVNTAASVGVRLLCKT